MAAIKIMNNAVNSGGDNCRHAAIIYRKVPTLFGNFFLLFILLWCVVNGCGCYYICRLKICRILLWGLVRWHAALIYRPTPGSA